MADNSETLPSTSHVDDMDRTNNLDSLVHNSSKWANWRVLMNLIIIGLGFGLFGYDNAFVSPLAALPLFVEKYQGLNPLGLPIFTARNLDLIVCVPLVGAAGGTFLAIPLQNILGRKNTYLVAYAFCSIPGSFLQLFAPNLAALVFGRFWNAVGISLITTVGPLYLSELVPARLRARAVGFTVAGAGSISVIATVVVWATEKLNDRRQYMIPLAIQAAGPSVLLSLTLLLTESPIWLLKKGRVDEANANLTLLRTDNPMLVAAELSAALVSLQPNEETASNIKAIEILKPLHLKRTLTAGALACLSQVGGQILTLTYSTIILVQSGVANPFKITIIIFLLQFLGSLVGPILIDKVGRRPVALTAFVILFIIDITAGSLACAGLKTNSEGLGLASMCIIFAFVNSVSFQSLCYLLPTEIPTSRLREPTITWTVFWSYCTAIITTFAVPQITSADATLTTTRGNLGAKAFLIFGGCMFITIIWSYFYLPETANRMLGEIDEMYALGLPMRKWRGYKTTSTTDAIMHKMESKMDGA